MAFVGITPEISLYLGKSRLEIYVTECGTDKVYDVLAEFDLLERRHPESKRFFCGLCEQPNYFQSRYDLWVEHSFEPLLSWMDKNFQDGKWLCVFTRDGFSEARIVDEHTLAQAKQQQLFCFAKPILISNRR